MRLLHRATSLLLPALLLFAQQVALAHVLSHLNPHQPPAQEKTLVHLKVCGKCVVAEKLTHAVSASTLEAAVGSAAYAQPVVRGCARVTRTFVAYSSRAPPVLL